MVVPLPWITWMLMPPAGMTRRTVTESDAGPVAEDVDWGRPPVGVAIGADPRLGEATVAA